MYLLLALLLALPQPGPQTSLVLTGAEQATFLTSDVNACAFDESNGALSGQLGDPTVELLLAFTVKGTVGDHPAQGQLTALTGDGPSDAPLVSWTATGGTVTLDDPAARVAVEAGDPRVPVSTAGVRGHLDADLTSPLGAFHVTGPFACHTAQ